MHLQAEVSAAGGGPWEGRLDLKAEAMDDRMGDLDNRIEELKKRDARKQRELVRLVEVEDEEETPPRGRGSAAARHQGERGSY